jgi:hypothetical protein
MEQLRAEVMKRHTLSFVEDSQLPPLCDYLRELKARHIEAERYLEARDANELLEYCKVEIQHRLDSQPIPPPDHEAESTVTGQKLSAQDRRIQEHDDRLHEKLAALEQRHQQELQEFEREWSEVMPERYRRPSKLLIEMREVAYNLALADRFEEAHARKVEADNLEQRELAEAQSRLNADYKQAKRKLLERHQEESGQMRATAELQRELLFSRRAAVEHAFANRILVLDAKPKSKGRSSPPSTSSLATTRSPPEKPFTRRLMPLKPPNAASSSSAKGSPGTPPGDGPGEE